MRKGEYISVVTAEVQWLKKLDEEADPFAGYQLLQSS